MIRKILKKIGFISDINSLFKSYKTKKEYNRICSYYRVIPKRQFNDLLNEKFHNRTNNLLKVNSDKINIFYVGTDYLQDSSGILQALSKLGNLVYFTNEKGQYGICPNNESYSVIRNTNSQRLLDLFNQLNNDGKTPDVLIGQMWNDYLDGKVLFDIKNKYGTIVVNIAMDDRHYFMRKKADGEWLGTFGLIPYIDFACTAAPECVDWYLKENCPAIYLPEASDSDIFHPMSHKTKIYDVCFIGLKYGIREQIVNKLRKKGIKVTVYGRKWESGVIDTKDVPEFFARSKVILGVGTIGHCNDFYALKMRDFDAPMSGSFYITSDNKDLYNLYEINKEIVTYRSINDCIEKIRYYLNHEQEREQIASAGYARVFKEHTWYHRFNTVLNTIRMRNHL
jgi:hypothetical protein